MNETYPGLFKVGLPQPDHSIRFSRKNAAKESTKRVDTYWVPELRKRDVSQAVATRAHAG